MRLQYMVVGVLSLITVATARAQDADPGIRAATSVLDSVFTAEQASRGEDVFMRICIDCHLPEEFVDGGYLRTWKGQMVSDLLAYIRDNMPEDNPGSLREGEYLSVLAYVLKLNGIPAGTRDLTGALANSTRIELP